MYGKLFTQMFDGTLTKKGPWQALVTFQQLVILADKQGVVDMTADAISRRTTIPLEIIETGIQALLQPDPESRSPDLEGRRIAHLDESRNWGWKITNYEHYRNLRSQEDRREYMRQYQRKRRANEKNVNHVVNNVSNVNQSSKQYAEASKDISSQQAAHPLVNGKSVETLPLKGGQSFEVSAEFVAELEPLFPAVGIPETLREMKGWCLGNPDRLKTRRGIKRFITRWLQSEQEKHGGQKTVR